MSLTVKPSPALTIEIDDEMQALAEQEMLAGALRDAGTDFSNINQILSQNGLPSPSAPPPESPVYLPAPSPESPSALKAKQIAQVATASDTRPPAFNPGA